MADDIFNVQPPAWLQAIAQPIDTKLTGQVLGAALAGATMASARAKEQVQTGTDAEGKPIYGERGGNWFKNFVGAAGDARMNMIDPMWRLKAQHLQLSQMSDLLRIAETQQDIKLKREQLAGRARDSAKTDWFALTPEERAKKPAPAFETTEYLTRQAGQQQADAHWMNVQSNTFIAKDYSTIRNDLLTKQGDAGIAALASLPPVQGPAPTERDLAALKAAQQSVLLTNRTKDFAREQQAIAAGMVPSLTLEPTPGSRVSYTPRAATGTAGATTFRQRFLRAQEINAEAVAPWANILGEPSPEAMAAFTAVETPLLAKAQTGLATAAGTPGASGTYNRTGLASATVPQERLYTGKVPATVMLDGGDKLIPVPQFRSDGRIAEYRIVLQSAGAPDRLVTPDQITSMAEDINNQITLGGEASGMTLQDKLARGKVRDALLDLAKDMVKSMEPAIREQIRLRKERYNTPPPVGGTGITNPPALGGPGSTNFNFGTNGVLTIEPAR